MNCGYCVNNAHIQLKRGYNSILSVKLSTLLLKVRQNSLYEERIVLLRTLL